jgi:hypothetical protein
VRTSDGTVVFKEWLPDLPDINNPGLTEALNVLPLNGVYKPYLAVLGNGDTLGSRPYGAIAALNSSSAAYLYAATQTLIRERSGTGWTTRSATTLNTAADGYVSFTQFDDLVVETNYTDSPLCLTVGSAANFATLATAGSAPKARCAGVVGRFLVLGDTDLTGATPNGIQWSAIDDPRNWPTPNSATALAVQAGEQFFGAQWGPVTFISNGEQYGIVFQRQAVSRMSYVGGDTVFQFDVIERSRGALFPNACVQIGRTVYFLSGDGFYVTDGIDVKPIGTNKVDNYFADTIDTQYKNRVRGAVDFANKCIYWIYPATGNTGGRPNRILIYNYEEGRWSRAVDETEAIISGLTLAITLDDLDAYFNSIDIATPSFDSDNWAGGNNAMLAFDSSNKIGAFSATSGSATIDGPEVELNPGGYSFVQGVKPLVTGTSPTFTTALGVRDSLGSSVSYGSATTATARTGFSDFRSTARYHRSRLVITGSFKEAVGVEYQVTPAGAT